MNDDELLRRLRGALPPVPEHVRALGRDAFRWHCPGATLASLAHDAGAPSAGVRGGGSRLLTFTGPGVGVELEITGREIVGWLSPPATAEVVLRSLRGERGTRTDDGGGFVLGGAPPGPVSLLFRLADATSVVTSWIHV